MISIKLTSDGDIDFSKGYLQWIDDINSISQHIISRLSFFKGQFSIRPDEGLPAFDYIFGKKDKDIAAEIIRKHIEKTPGVNNIIEYEYNFDIPIRALSIDVKLDTIYGITKNIIEIKL